MALFYDLWPLYYCKYVLIVFFLKNVFSSGQYENNDYLLSSYNIPGTGLGTLFNVNCLISTLQLHKGDYLNSFYFKKAVKLLLLILWGNIIGGVTKLHGLWSYI